MKKVIDWKIFYYIPLNNYILYYCPSIVLLSSIIKGLKKDIKNNWANFKEDLNILILEIDNKITILDNHLISFKTELMNIILHIISQPLFYMGYKIYNHIYFDFYYVIEFIKKYKYELIFFNLIFLFIIITYKYSYFLYKIANYTIFITNRRKFKQIVEKRKIDPTMTYNFQRAEPVSAGWWGYVTAEICVYALSLIQRVIMFGITIPWPVMFTTLWSYSNQIMEPEREMRRNKILQRIRMTIGFLLAWSDED
jgi:hypothetical protein